jgi:hypothetical protein
MQEQEREKERKKKNYTIDKDYLYFQLVSLFKNA